MNYFSAHIGSPKGSEHGATLGLNDAAEARSQVLHLEEIASLVKGQSSRFVQPGGKGASHSARREFINVAAEEPTRTTTNARPGAPDSDSGPLRAIHSVWWDFHWDSGS